MRQLAFEGLPAVLAEILQAPGFGAVAGVTAFGKAVDLAVAGLIEFWPLDGRLAVFVEFSMCSSTRLAR
ncbi:hypothetical protein JJD82_27900 [Pseudomonas sp. MF6747]|uniref:hypothetical protein n=1 Tax=Pseudomonas sp. MF6747 TaxID=2797527 RepID=UPI00190C4E88|nr:hypothetical protein [Pseudomonas sp. MF6747]MBK3510819.1 hypothetical protein [Pseudomonas sp. MF6747]